MDDRDSTVDEPTSPVHPIATYPPIFANLDASRPVMHASGRRAAEFYGFVAWLLTLLVYIAYLMWTILPDGLIQAMGIDWYPARQVSPLEMGDELMLARVQRMVYPDSSMVCDVVSYRLFCVHCAGNLRDPCSVQHEHHHRWVQPVMIFRNTNDRQFSFIKIRARTTQHGLQETMSSEEDYTRNLRLRRPFLLHMIFLWHLSIECSMDGAVDPRG